MPTGCLLVGVGLGGLVCAIAGARSGRTLAGHCDQLTNLGSLASLFARPRLLVDEISLAGWAEGPATRSKRGLSSAAAAAEF